MALSSNKYALKVQRLEKILAQTAAPNSARMAKSLRVSQGHPKPAFAENVERWDQGKFFKNRSKSSPCLKGPKALWRKLNYTLIKMHLKCKDWKYFGANSGSKSVRMGKLWQLSQGHPKPAFSGKVKRDDQVVLSYNYYAVKMQRLDKIVAQKKLQKCPKGQVMAIFETSPKTRVF